jgi:hypothetical protein
MKVKISLILLLFCLLYFLSGCSAVDDEEAPSLVPATLIYMVADNNLDFYAMLNIRQMERGFPDNAVGHVFVFLTRRRGANPSHPYLMKITQNKDDNIIRSPIIQTYRQQNTVNPDFMRQVIADVKEHSRRHGAELRRLILWSHGTGWLPEGASFNEIDYIDNTMTGKNSGVSFSFGLDETGYGDGAGHNRE